MLVKCVLSASSAAALKEEKKTVSILQIIVFCYDSFNVNIEAKDRNYGALVDQSIPFGFIQVIRSLIDLRSTRIAVHAMLVFVVLSSRVKQRASGINL